jgi:hypothetical protein
MQRTKPQSTLQLLTRYLSIILSTLLGKTASGTPSCTNASPKGPKPSPPLSPSLPEPAALPAPCRPCCPDCLLLGLSPAWLPLTISCVSCCMHAASGNKHCCVLSQRPPSAAVHRSLRLGRWPYSCRTTPCQGSGASHEGHNLQQYTR